MPVHYHNSPPQLNSACSMWWLVYIHFAAYTQYTYALALYWLFFRGAVEKAKGLVLIACSSK